MKDIITGKEIKMNPLNKSKLELYELDNYMLEEDEE